MVSGIIVLTNLWGIIEVWNSDLNLMLAFSTFEPQNDGSQKHQLFQIGDWTTAYYAWLQWIISSLFYNELWRLKITLDTLWLLYIKHSVGGPPI